MERSIVGRLTLIALMVGAVGGAIVVRAALESAAQSARFVIGVEDLDYFPLWSVKGGRYDGAAREILDAFATSQGYAFEYRPLAVTRLHTTFLEGGVDFKFPDHPNWRADLKKGKAVVYSAPVIAFIDGAMTTPERKGKGIGAVKTLGSVTGFSPWVWMDDIQKGSVQVRENADVAALIRQTQLGRVDAAYVNVAVANYHLDQVLKQPGALVFDPSLPHNRDTYFLSTLKHGAAIEAFNRWLQASKASVEAIKRRHQAEKGVTR